MNTPTKEGLYGKFGGSYCPPALQQKLDAIDVAFEQAMKDHTFEGEYRALLHNYCGRPTPITECKNLTAKYGGARLFLKREDLNHTGAHKINNAIAQVILAKRMGMKHIIAETGAGQHGVATATVAALFGIQCTIFMGATDIQRQSSNVSRMKLLGAKVVSVSTGNAVLKDAVDAALEAFVKDDDSFYVLGSAVGPNPYPKMVHMFQKVISEESRKQMLEKTGKLPNEVVACVGGGSNAIGSFSFYIKDDGVRLIGVEPAGKGIETGEHAAALTKGKIGVIHGFKSYVLQDDSGEIAPVYSISAGLDYPSVGPEHSFLRDSGRAEYVTATDQEALDAFRAVCHFEGIIPALESSHALAYAFKVMPTLSKDDIILVTLSGRGDKDMEQIIEGGYFSDL